jgi:hypothetical protein
MSEMRVDAKGRFILRTRLPPNLQVQYLIYATVFIGLFIFGWLFSKVSYEIKLDLLKNFIILLAVLSPIILFQLWLNKSQTSYYDDDALYFGLAEWQWRKLRFVQTEIVLRYDEIAEIVTVGELNIQPFVYVRFRREGRDWVKNPFLSRLFLRDEEIKECLRFMYTKVPDKYPPELIDFMNSPPVVFKYGKQKEGRFSDD